MNKQKYDKHKYADAGVGTRWRKGRTASNT